MSDPFNDAESGENHTSLSRQFAVSTNRRLEFHKRSQLFIRAHNETLSIVAMRVCNPDRAPVRTNCGKATPTPTAFAQIVGDDLSIFHARSS